MLSGPFYLDGIHGTKSMHMTLVNSTVFRVPLADTLVFVSGFKSTYLFDDKISAVLNVNSGEQASVELPKKLIHPPSAARILLPDGRHMAYHEKGVSAERARFSLIAPHSFLSSRLAGTKQFIRIFMSEFDPYPFMLDMSFPVFFFFGF